MRRKMSSRVLSAGDFDMADTNNELGDQIDGLAVILGRLAIAWNTIPLCCGSLFIILAHPDNSKLGWAIWNAVANDRMQRKVLEAAVEAAPNATAPLKKRVRWAMGEITSLESQRDTALHAPYLRMPAGRLGPLHHTGHLRAVQLKYADLESMLHSNAIDMIDLSLFVSSLAVRLGANDGTPWPQKPSLQRLKPPKTPEEPNQKNAPK